MSTVIPPVEDGCYSFRVTVTIDGAQGEGGGQILRSSLALSIITQTPLELVQIRAKRKQPGLRPQHLMAVQAAAQISGAEVEGAKVGARRLRFVPGPVRPGSYRFSIGTAGSGTMVFQTVLPPLMLAEAPSTVVIEGGTHNAKAPPFEFIERAFLPVLAKIGPQVTATLNRPGFYPKGGGQMTFHIQPSPSTARLSGWSL